MRGREKIWSQEHSCVRVLSPFTEKYMRQREVKCHDREHPAGKSRARVPAQAWFASRSGVPSVVLMGSPHSGALLPFQMCVFWVLQWDTIGGFKADVTWLWRPPVPNPGLCRVGFLLRAERKRSLSGLSSWLTSVHLPASSHVLPCVWLCPNFFFS